MTKKELRSIYKQKRLEISSKEKLKLDDLLLIRFQQMAFENVEVLLSYWPMAHHAEPNTVLYTSYLRHSIPGLRIGYTRTNFEDCSMQAVEINEDTLYTTNHIGITEPCGEVYIAPEEIDLVFVPMLICDENGYRVGFGKGFYDRFLSRCRPDILKVGFSYFEPVATIADRNEFDIPLDYCITQDRIYEF